MIRNLFFAFIAVFSLQGCLGSGLTQQSGDPWNRGGQVQEAQAVPGDITQREQWIAGQTPPSAVTAQALPGMAQPPLPQTAGSSAYNATFGNAGTQMQTPPVAPPPAALPPVKVAILVPLSGSSADVGEAILNAAQLALFDVGADTFELMPRDTKGTAPGAAAAAQSALHEGAQLILGPLFTEEVRAVTPIAAASNVNVVAFTTDWKQAGGNTFVMGFMPFGQVQRVVSYAAAKGIRRIGVIAPQTEYGNAVMSAYNAAAQRYGITTVDSLRFHPGDTGLSVPMQNFSRIGARKLANGAFAPPPFDAVFLPAGGSDAQTISNLMSYYELDPAQVRRLGTGLWDDGALRREANLNGGWFAAPDPYARAVFESKYRDAYGSTPPRLASLGYDATALAAVLAKTGLSTRGTPAFDRAAITNPNGFAGIDGIFRFHEDGLAERGLAILEMRGGQISVVDPAPRTFQSATQ